ncbi:MAG TPA: ABC transporter ATP-binding protein [Thermoleophilaceae bacterium]|nr:ABC transporter ATP-binding protein [Thermoleophilaceae bacterium]
MSEPALELRGVVKAYDGVMALDGVDLEVSPGELVTLLGPSGSGKSTLLSIVAGFEAPSSGEVSIRGRDVLRMAPAEREVGMVFQSYALFPHMTVAENLGYGLKVRRHARVDRARRVGELLDLLRLPGYGDRYPRQLSGGEQQRVALGRALAYDPEIVLMDEPLGALDRSLRAEMEQELRRIQHDLSATVLYVTHDQHEALALSDRIAVMRAGRVVGIGAPEQLYREPTDGFVARFFANANLLPVDSFELDAAGMATVRCLGQRVRCRAPARPAGRAVLAVRPRSLRRHGDERALKLAATVTETLLLGDERRVTLEVVGAGPVVALLDARDSTAMAPGAAVELFAAPQEAVLVPEERE